MTEFEYVDDYESLVKACKTISRSTVIAVDLECENHFHHYGIFISLIQVSTDDGNWIFDGIRLKNILPLLNIFSDSSKTKIFHDTSFDLRILYHQYKCLVRNIYDTQAAAKFLNEEKMGLKGLLEKYFDVSKKSRFQKADWSMRPLRKDMLEYAIKDTIYLIRLKDIFDKKLKQLGRTEWMSEEMKHLEDLKWEIPDFNFIDIKGAKKISPHQRAILKRLFDLRDKLAKKVDRPVHFIINSKRLLEFSINPPTYSEWKSMSGVHPIVRQHALEFSNAIARGKSDPPIPYTHPRYKFTEEQKEKKINIEEKREILAKRLNLPRSVILGNDDLRHFILGEDVLRNWQKKLFGLKTI